MLYDTETQIGGVPRVRSWSWTPLHETSVLEQECGCFKAQETLPGALARRISAHSQSLDFHSSSNSACSRLSWRPSSFCPSADDPNRSNQSRHSSVSGTQATTPAGPPQPSMNRGGGPGLIGVRPHPNPKSGFAATQIYLHSDRPEPQLSRSHSTQLMRSI